MTSGRGGADRARLPTRRLRNSGAANAAAQQPRDRPKKMATWYGAHIAQAASNSEGGPDGEALVLELWELLAFRGSDVGRLGAVATRLLGHAVAPAPARAARGSRLRFKIGLVPARPPPGLLQELTRIGAGANPMPFAVPSVRGCRLQARQRVRTTGAEVTLEHVLATS